MEELFTQALLASSALTAHVGDRIKWKRQDQGAALPHVTLHRLHVRRFYTMKGRVPTIQARLQIDIDAGSDAEAGAVLDLVAGVIDTLNARPLLVLLNDDPPDGWTPEAGPDADLSSDVFRRSLDANAWHWPG